MTPKQIERIKTKIKRIKAALAADKNIGAVTFMTVKDCVTYRLNFTFQLTILRVDFVTSIGFKKTFWTTAAIQTFCSSGQLFFSKPAD